MMLALHFIFGFITSFLGSLTPSMLNVTAAKISLNKGKNSAIKFAIGVSVIVFIQAYVATLFTRYFPIFAPKNEAGINNKKPHKI